MSKRKPNGQHSLFPAELTTILEKARELREAVAALPFEQRVDAINAVRALLHEASPFAAEPVDCVLWHRAEDVRANDYNPNAVAPPEMIALGHSVETYGYTMPIVVTEERGSKRATLVVTDGFHRKRIGTENQAIRERLHGYLPVSILKGQLTREQQMSATVLHNKARGEHSIAKEMSIVEELDRAGWSPEQMSVGLVKTDEELIRIRQTGGIAQRLANPRYDKAWTF
jgi:ParB-like chromosome segregation protein Spo0J